MDWFTLGLGFVAGAVVMLLLAKWQPTWFLKAETAVVTGVSDIANTVASKIPPIK